MFLNTFLRLIEGNLHVDVLNIDDKLLHISSYVIYKSLAKLKHMFLSTSQIEKNQKQARITPICKARIELLTLLGWQTGKNEDITILQLKYINIFIVLPQNNYLI